SRSAFTVTLTWPRAILRRRRSRISPSQRWKDDGTLKLGLKNLWLTVRISTVTLVFPTTPSAAPNPVMLRIIAKPLNIGAAIVLSIPEAPPDPIQNGRTRHEVPRHRLVIH